MNKKERYKISVGSANEYEDMIAEVLFSETGGVIISQENGEGIFEISLHSFKENQADDFDFCRNIQEGKILLDDFMNALTVAIDELKRLKISD